MQGSLTRRQFREAAGRRELDTLSRIGRVSCNAPAAFLLARGASAWVEERVFSGMLSDHIGLGFRRSLARGTRRRVVPRWVAADPRLPAMVEPTAKDVGVHELAGLEGVTACICAVAKRIEQTNRSSAKAAAPELSAHWLAACRTACLRRERCAFLDAVARIPDDADLFDVGLLRARSEAACADALQALVHERFVADQRTGLRMTSDELERRSVRRRYGCLASWPPRRRTICRTVVLGETGAVIGSDVGAAEALASHWRPRSRARV